MHENTIDCSAEMAKFLFCFYFEKMVMYTFYSLSEEGDYSTYFIHRGNDVTINKYPTRRTISS